MPIQMSFKQWCAKLGDPIALEFAGPILGLPVEELIRAIRMGKLHVYRFKAADGRTFRMVKRSDVRKLTHNPLLGAMRPQQTRPTRQTMSATVKPHRTMHPAA